MMVIHLNLALVLSLTSTLTPIDKSLYILHSSGLHNRGLNACSYGTNT